MTYELLHDEINYCICYMTNSKHKESDTYEAPGGHKEAGENIFETAKRAVFYIRDDAYARLC